MNENNDGLSLMDLAKKASEEASVDTSGTSVDTTDDTVDTRKTVEDDDDFTIIDRPMTPPAPKPEQPAMPSDMNVPQTEAPKKPVPVPVDDVDLGITGNVSPEIMSQLAPKMSEKEREMLVAKNSPEFMNYTKTLIMSGLTPEEANKAAEAHFAKSPISDDEADDTSDNDGDVAIVEIDKKNADNIEFTDDEKAKLHKVKAIKLVVVQDEELKSIEIDDGVDAEHKADYIRAMETNLSRYSVPLPMNADFMSFSGAQIIQLVDIVMHEDDRAEDIISHKANLVYNKMMNSPQFTKFDEYGKVIMSYTEFCNNFMYTDLEMAFYGVICASVMEDATMAEVTCNKCNHSWNQPYNVKTMCQMDSFSDTFKGRFETILTHRNDKDFLKRMRKDQVKTVRYKSPFTQNIYDIDPPSIARSLAFLRRVNQEDTVMMYNSAIAQFMKQILIYNKGNGKYVSVTEEDPNLILETMGSLPDADIQMIYNQVRDNLSYNAKFAIQTKCPSCGNSGKMEVPIANLVFLQARDSYREIR